MESFDKISENFNTNFITSGEEELKHLENDLTEFEIKKNELKAFVESKKELTLEDKGFLQLEHKTLYQNGRLVLDKLQTEIKQGSSPRMYEVYSALLSTLMSGLRELRELNKMILDIERYNNAAAGLGQSGNTVNVFVSSKEMLNMIKKAKNENSLNAVDGTFKDVKD